MENIELLQNKIRRYDKEKDKDLPVFSYSKLDNYNSCPFSYDLKYNKKHRPPQNSIPLDVGTLCHKILELKARMIMDNQKIDYTNLVDILHKGIEEKTDKGSEMIIGVDQIKSKFGFEEWFSPDNKSHLNYEEKTVKFVEEVLPYRLQDSDWVPFGCETQFDFCYNYGNDEEPKWIHLYGFIDLVSGQDFNDEGMPQRIKVTDYKTSKAIYDKTKTTTSLQQTIYGLAIFNSTGILPEEYEYDFILINAKQLANTKGYLARGIKKLDKLFDSLFNNQKTGMFKPKPCPLCYWCDFGITNPSAIAPYKTMCSYYSLWTPTNKSYQVNMTWNDGVNDGSTRNSTSSSGTSNPVKRKLVF